MGRDILVCVFMLLVFFGCRSRETATSTKTPATDPPSVRSPPAVLTTRSWNLLCIELLRLEVDLDQAKSLASLQPQALSQRLEFIKGGVSRVQKALREVEAIAPERVGPSSRQDFNTIEHQLPDVLRRVQRAEELLNRRAERFAVDASRYELRRQKYREHLLKGIAGDGVADEAVYADDAVVIYAQAYAMPKEALCVQLYMGLIEPRPLTEELWQHRGIVSSRLTERGRTQIAFAPIRDSRDIFVYDHAGNSMGSPTTVGVQISDSVAIVELGFTEALFSRNLPLKVVVARDAFLQPAGGRDPRSRLIEQGTAPDRSQQKGISRWQ